MSGEATTTTASADERVARLEAELAAERAARIAERATAAERLAALTAERDRLKASHERLRLELELLKRRIFVAKAERVDSAQLELEFADKLRQLDALAGTLGMAGSSTGTEGADGEGESRPKKDDKPKPKGRRDLSKLPLSEKRIELVDPMYEELVAAGKARRIDFDESYQLGWQRGGLCRVVVARAKYQVVGDDGQTSVDTTPMPPRAFPRSLAASSLLAHILMEKYGKGLPLYRIEDGFARDGVSIDRGTMCRWVEDAGGTAGATVIEAARKEAFESAFCIATDATGILVQPIANDKPQGGARRACRRGHYFVHIADRDHVFFEYTSKETSAVVAEMFKGFSGYLQADAKSVYDILFREPDKPPDGDDDASVPCKEVGCWSHARRRYWEAALAKSTVAREGLARIGRIFELDESWRRNPPAEIKRLRDLHLRPHVEAFFAWAEVEYDKVRHIRGPLRSALGYSVRQKLALMRFLDDGRLALDNNASERELRRIATGRKAWLFVGSDEHAASAGNILSLIASARLHRLDPEAYLRDFFRVLPHWPTDRYLELAPKYWALTRARLDPQELEAELGPLTIPPPLPPAPEEQPAPNGGA